MSPAPRRRWVAWCLVAYALLVAAVVLAPVSFSEVIDTVRGWIRVDLGLTSFGFGWVEFTANVLMFLPLGFLLTLLLRHHWYGVVLALVLSAGAEIVQVVMPSRVPSVRDVLANTVGAAIGAGLAWLFVLRRESKRPGVGNSGPAP